MSTSIVSRAAAVAALTLAGSAIAGAHVATAAPGDNGDIKIHKVGTPFSDPREDAKVCEFYLDASNFDAAASLTYTVTSQPPSPNGATLNGTVALQAGSGHSDPLALPNGQYQLTYKIAGAAGAGKQKVFNVDCPSDKATTEKASASASASPAPRGGVHAGGGGLAEKEDSISPVAGAAAVGLVAAGGVVYFRLLRRRNNGAA
ncbi:hypothetical protein ACFV6E_06980 [Streptomyces sp. NPDC059785]|uniref:hypothetical protein n=1 Tax=unclassified Streptomyces TaxID=2593676 RepID=UPI0036628F03